MGLNQTALHIRAISYSAAQLLGCEANHSSQVVPSLKMSGVKLHFHKCFHDVRWEFILHKFIFPTADILRGPGSSVSIATAYGLDCPGIESRWGRDFPLLSRPALRTTHPPVQWVPGLSRG